MVVFKMGNPIFDCGFGKKWNFMRRMDLKKFNSNTEISFRILDGLVDLPFCL